MEFSSSVRKSSDNVNLTTFPYDPILQFLTRSSEMPESSVISVSWVEEARKTFLSNITAVTHPMDYLRDVAIIRGAVSGPAITDVVVIRSMLSVPSRVET